MKTITKAALLVSALSAGAISPSAYAGERAQAALPSGQESALIFRQGDKVPLSLAVGGDLIEAENQPLQYLTVKRDFLMRIRGDKFELSLDGSEYKPFDKFLTGNLSLSTGSAGELVVGLKALLR